MVKESKKAWENVLSEKVRNKKGSVKMDKSFKELMSLRQKVRRSRLEYFEKIECYSAIAKLARLLGFEEEYSHGRKAS